MKKYLLTLALLMTVPAVALGAPAGGTVDDFLTTLTDIINSVIAFLIVIASLVFIFGIIRYLTNAGDPETVQQARQFIIWSLIGLAVIFVFWGIVNLIVSTLDVGDNAPDTIPSFDFTPGS